MLDRSQTDRARSGVADRVAAVTALAADRAAEAEAARRLTPDVVDALVEAGFARHFVPAGFGGSEGSFAEAATAVADVGEGCAASAWCASLMANLPRFAAYLPLEGQQEIWQDGPDVVVVGSPSPFGRASSTPGGWLVSGTWPYISGVDYARWVLVCAAAPDAGTVTTPRFFAVPIADCRVVDTWSNVGMLATGS
ncbi:MAG TPA: acyl-CoA dehydrogenase family protein, partial [Kineosporiaceae bacterium]